MKSVFYILFVLILVLNCEQKQQATGTLSYSTDTTQASTDREDNEDSGECESIGSKKCEEDCKKICDRIFSGSHLERKCSELSAELVDDFDDLLKDVKKGETDEINTDTLSCLLDIDEKPLVSSLKSLSISEAKEFLINIVNDITLTEILKEEDTDLKIIKQLLIESSGSGNLEDMLDKEIEDRKPLFWYTADEGNKDVLRWMDSYLREHCDRVKADCPGYRDIGPLGAYCPILKGYSESRLKSFISEADAFSDLYKSEVEDKGYEYKATGSKNLKDFCKKSF